MWLTGDRFTEPPYLRRVRELVPCCFFFVWPPLNPWKKTLWKIHFQLCMEKSGKKSKNRFTRENIQNWRLISTKDSMETFQVGQLFILQNVWSFTVDSYFELKKEAHWPNPNPKWPKTGHMSERPWAGGGNALTGPAQKHTQMRINCGKENTWADQGSQRSRNIQTQ